jgi:4-hydroxy-3-methylbut-2-en-1-yl diphosphate reductase
MKVTIDPHSGFCFGVVNAIAVAERELRANTTLFCLGDIVHNDMEVNRLKKLGMKIIGREEYKEIHHCKVLIRAHGEPPETYKIAIQNHLELIDATCPIVLNLQNAVHLGYLEMLSKNGQIVIYGKADHAEVVALVGQTNGSAYVVEHEADLEALDFSRPVRFYSQTTKGVEGFYKFVQIISQRMQDSCKGNLIDFEWNDSICRQVSTRSEKLREFASRFDVVVFVGGQQSSNGMILFGICKEVNPRSYLVSGSGDLHRNWFENVQSTGICGATSTPLWLMEEIAGEIQKYHD